MTTQNEKNNQDFYTDLDKSKHKVHFGCAGLIYFLLFLFISGSIIIVMMIKLIRSNLSQKEFQIPQITLEKSEEKLQGFIAKLKNTKSGESVSITFNDEELSALLAKSEYLAKSDSIEVQNATAKITPENIAIDAGLTKPINSKLTILGKPVISNGAIKFEVSSIKAGKLGVPNFLSSSLERVIDNLVSKRLNDNGIIYEAVSLNYNNLTLSGRR